ncbi:MAG: hypothetical protein VZR53_19375, partial [Prevotella sp.]|nr:hypothetical protein [Prevotella sp.]
MELRNLFDAVFGTKKQIEPQLNTYKILNGQDAIFTGIANTYDSKVVRTAIDRIATHSAKLTPKHIQNDINHPIKGSVNFILQNRPNPIMSTYD